MARAYTYSRYICGICYMPETATEPDARLVSPRGTLRTHAIRILYTLGERGRAGEGEGEGERGTSARTTLCVSSPQLGTLPTFKIHMYLQDTLQPVQTAAVAH